MNINPVIVLGLFGSLTSILSFVISLKKEHPKWIHAIYTFIITVITGLYFLYSQSISQELETRNSIEHNASHILSTYSNLNDNGENRGFILTSFAFLEKYKDEIPETYEIAKTLVVDGLKITENSYGRGISAEYDEETRLEDGASTMKALLEGMRKSNY